MKKLGIRSHGLVAVLIPLLFELAMVSWIVSIIFQSQADLQSVSRQRAVTSDLHRLIWESVDAVFQMHINSDTAGLIDVDTTNRERARFERRLNSLNSRTWDTDQQAHVLDLNKTAKDMLNCLSWVQIEQSKGMSHWKKVNSQCFDIFNQSTLSFIDVVRTILLTEEKNLAAKTIGMEKSSKAIETALNLAIPGSALVSVLFVCFYALGILRPLNHIIENGHLLSKRKPLLKMSTGDDELSQLDRLMHAVADSVEEAFSREKSMLENATDLICSLDQELRFCKANRAVERIFGISQEDVFRQPVFDLVVPADAEIIENELKRSRAMGHTITFEVRMQSIDQNSIFDTRWSVFWSENQQQYFCVIHDVSEAKNIARLKQDFLDMVSHDLRSPLMSMHGSITLISEGAKGPVSERMKNDMKTAQANISTLTNFVNDLLEFQQLQSANIELVTAEFDLGEMIQEAFKLVEDIAEAKSVEVKLPEGEWMITGDEKQLLRAFLNILNNAIKFSPEASAVSVEVHQDAQSVDLSVTDSGPGISLEHREQIFEAFKQVPGTKTKEGSGLGLAIAKLVVERHGGSIGVREGRHGSGSMFWISLPHTRTKDVNTERRV